MEFVRLIAFGFLCRIAVSAEVGQCSWTGSGSLSGSQEGSVRVVQLHCVDGKLMWKHPEGALMVRLQPPMLAEGAVWNFCLRALPGHTRTAIYRRDNESLVLLLGTREESEEEICFQSAGAASLYLQTEKGSSASRGALAGFFYSMTPSPPSPPDWETCEPCTIEQTAEAFCSSEFIFKGRPTGRRQRERAPFQELEFRLEKLLRKPAEYSEVLRRTEGKSMKMIGRVLMPSRCPVDLRRVDADDVFLVVGQMVLGRAKLRCAVPWSDWVSHRLRQQSTGPCDLS